MIHPPRGQKTIDSMLLKKKEREQSEKSVQPTVSATTPKLQKRPEHQTQKPYSFMSLKNSRVSFSQHKSHSVIEFFRKILKDSPNKIINFFKDKEKKLLEQNKKNDHQAFWSHTDFKLESMRVRINTCPYIGEYIFYFNHPESEKQMAENKGSAGLSINCKLNDIKKLVKFLVKKNK
jgi:hypothetical protein